jgi:hypothetical protein
VEWGKIRGCPTERSRDRCDRVARDAGVEYFVYTSVGSAERETASYPKRSGLEREFGIRPTKLEAWARSLS